MTQIYNTSLEISMRVLLLLNAANEPLNIDRMVYLDIFSLYSKQYGYGTENLHGENKESANEYTIRRAAIDNSIKELLARGLINVDYSNKGYRFKIANTGTQICESINNEYANKYSQNIKLVHEKIKNKSENELMILLTNVSEVKANV